MSLKGDTKMKKIFLAISALLICSTAHAGWSGWQQFYDSIIPNADNYYDLGASDRAWKNIYADGTISSTGTISAGSITTTGVDERIYGTTYLTNYLDFNDSATAVTINAVSTPSVTSATTLTLGSAAGYPVNFTIGGNTSMTINNTTGNVGIGTLTPRAKLEVDGMIYLTSNDGSTVKGYLGFDGATNAIDIATYTAHPVRIETSNAVRMTVASDGTITLPLVTSGAALCMTAGKQLGHCTGGTFTSCTCVGN